MPIARLLLAIAAASSPDWRYPHAARACTRWPVSVINQRMSCGVTRCQVGRRAQDVGAEDGPGGQPIVDIAGGEIGGALCHRPPRASVILGLNGTEPTDDVAGRSSCGVQQVLVAQPFAKDVHGTERYTRPG